MIPDVSQQSIASLISLKGRSAVITGGAKGLGAAIARRFAEAGASVLIGDIDESGAAVAAEQIAKATGSKVLATRLDVCDSASIAAAADKAVAAFGRIDIWVNNAGIYPLTPVLEMRDEDWDKVTDINLRGTFIGCREAARRMCADNKGGVIINLASTAGFKGAGPGVTHYVASKHGVRGITRQMALELADRNVRLLAVTEGVRAAMEGPAAEAGFELEHTYNSLLGRPGVPDDVARVALFCASDMSLFMTGSTLPVDAGELIR